MPLFRTDEADSSLALSARLTRLFFLLVAACVATVTWESISHIADLYRPGSASQQILTSLLRDRAALSRAVQQNADQSKLQSLASTYLSRVHQLHTALNDEDGLRGAAPQDALSLIISSANDTSALAKNNLSTADQQRLLAQLNKDQTLVENATIHLSELITIASLADRRSHANHILYSMTALILTTMLLIALIIFNSRQRFHLELLSNKAQRSKEVQTATSHFLAHMSHEIRTPLNGILGTIQLINPNSLSAENKGLLAVLKHSSNVLLGIVNDFLDSAKIEAGDFRLSPHPFDLREFVADVISQNASRFNDKEVDFLVRVDNTLPREIQGDRLRLEQIMSNLISNAVKFTERGSVLFEVRRTDEPHQTRSPSHSIAFVVSDTGIGIREKDQQALFAPFKQIDNSLTRHNVGTGLGLSIVKKLAEKMGGVASLKSEFGEGTTITVEIPHVGVKEVDTRVNALDTYASGNCQVAMFGENSTVFRASLLLSKLGVSVNVLRTKEDAEAFLRAPPEALTSIIVDRSFTGDAVTWLMHIGEKHRLRVNVPIIVFRGTRVFPKVDSALNIHELMGQLTCSNFLEALREVAPTIEVNYRNSQSEQNTSMEKIPLPIQRTSVLIVDDNSINRQILARILTNFGIDDVSTASDALEGIEKLEKRTFDIIFMDVQMPNIDGYMATKMIRDRGYKDIKIFACSAHALESDIRRSLEEGLDGHISKPVISSELLALLKRAVLSS